MAEKLATLRKKGGSGGSGGSSLDEMQIISAKGSLTDGNTRTMTVVSGKQYLLLYYTTAATRYATIQSGGSFTNDIIYSGNEVGIIARVITTTSTSLVIKANGGSLSEVCLVG